MKRCGVSWIGEVISQIHERLYGRPLFINYEEDRGKVSNNLLEGWTGVYDVDPKVLIQLGYDKILIVKRELEAMKEAHAYYHGYIEMYGSIENMKKNRPAFFDKIELYHDLIYHQEEVKNNPKVLIVSLENLNNYTYSTFNEIIDFFDFKLSFKQKLKFFKRVLKDKIKPFVIPTNPKERNWNIHSALLPKGQELCERLKYLKKIEIEVR
jgi:hypothetical protein